MKNKVVLITGSSSGIGKAAVIHFAQKGWQVAATQRNTDNENPFAAFPNVRRYTLDVTNTQSISATFQQVATDFGGIDVVVNNAGYGVDGVFEAMSDEVIEKQFDTNVFGLMRVTREAIPYLRAQQGGSLVQISSMGGRVTFPLFSIYHGTKWAVEGFSESLHYELERFNIQVKLVEPGAIKTDFYGRSREFINRNDLPYTDYVAKISAKNQAAGAAGAAPEKVAEVIYKAATDRNRKMRYTVGYPAGLLVPLRWLLPNRWFFKFIKANY